MQLCDHLSSRFMASHTTGNPVSVTTTPIYSIDILLGLICFICGTFGAAFNLMALWHFVRQMRLSPTIPAFIYSLIALNDTVTW